MGCALLALALLAGRAQAGEPVRLDWCAPVAWQADQARQDGDRCIARFSEAEMARARLVAVGTSWDVTEPDFVHRTGRCAPSQRHAENRARWQRIRERHAERGGERLWIVHAHRFDLVTDTLAMAPEFDGAFLLRTTRPWSDVLAFFERDRSPLCAPGGCRWSDAHGANEEREDGPSLAASIERVGGKGLVRKVVYYVGRGSNEQSTFSPVGVVADLRNAKYRAWRVAEAKRALAAGGYDAIVLNQKFHQYREQKGGYWLGSERLPDPSAIRAGGDTPLTAPPLGYGYPDYVAGWSALAAELRAAGVPYAVTDLPADPFLDRADDPATPDRDEAQAIREVLRGAAVVLLDQGRWSREARIEALAAELRGAGVDVIRVDSRCGLGGQEPPKP